MQEQTQFAMVSSTVAGPRIRMHKSCNPDLRKKMEKNPDPDCCQLCGGQFIADHPQLAELPPFDCERFDLEHAPIVPAEQPVRIQKKRISTAPKKTQAAKTKGRPA